MSLESHLSYSTEDLLLDSSYLLTVISYITPLTLGAYTGITSATNLPHSSHLPNAISINALGTSTLVALNSREKKLKYASLGALSATITAPILYGIGYGIGYVAGRVVY